MISELNEDFNDVLVATKGIDFKTDKGCEKVKNAFKQYLLEKVSENVSLNDAQITILDAPMRLNNQTPCLRFRFSPLGQEEGCDESPIHAEAVARAFSKFIADTKDNYVDIGEKFTAHLLYATEAEYGVVNAYFVNVAYDITGFYCDGIEEDVSRG